MSYLCWPLPFLRDLDKLRVTNGRECFHEYSEKKALKSQQHSKIKTTRKSCSLYIHTLCEIHKNSAKQRTAKKNRQTNESERIFFAYVFTYLLRCYSSQQIPVGCWKNASFFAISLAYSSFEFFIFFFPRIFPRRGLDRKDKACK